MRNKKLWQRFMAESNMIEGENYFNPGDEAAFNLAVAGIKTEEDILTLHRILTRHLKVKWSGRYRTCNVQAGNYTPPRYHFVPELMKAYMIRFPTIDSWTAHNAFEKIHPFEDFNGRTGRLIWLSKAIEEGYGGTLPFLHEYYYQTLEKEG